MSVTEIDRCPIHFREKLNLANFTMAWCESKFLILLSPWINIHEMDVVKNDVLPNQIEFILRKNDNFIYIRSSLIYGFAYNDLIVFQEINLMFIIKNMLSLHFVSQISACRSKFATIYLFQARPVSMTVSQRTHTCVINNYILRIRGFTYIF